MRLIKGRDIVDVVAISVLFVLAGIVPERYWGRISHRLAKLHVICLGFSGDHLGKLPDQLLGRSARDLEIDFRQHSYWELLEILRDYWPGGWRPRTTLIGEEHIRAALAEGKGVVFWFSNFTRAMIPYYQETQKAGYPLNVLMHGTHGFSDTRFGVRILNPIRVAIERRFLGNVFTIGDDGAGPAIRQLIQCLKENKCIHIAAIQSGKHVCERPFLGGRIRIAKGGPSIALSTGAALLPVFPVPVGPSSYEIHVKPALTSDAGDDGQKQDDMVAEFVSLLEPYVREWPHLWRGWIGSPNYWRPGREAGTPTPRVEPQSPSRERENPA